VILRPIRTLVLTAAAAAALMVVFAVSVDRFRGFEGTVAVDLLHVLGAPQSAIQALGGVMLAVIPPGHGGFMVYIAPACSSLASALSLAFLSLFTPRSLGWWRLCAPAAAVFCVVVGNILRLAGSLALGLWDGESSLVLFHDWVGTIFTYVYTVGGYLLMLSLLLALRRRRENTTEQMEESDVG
jgi:exosortase/archaeosortase family protein